MSDMPDISEQEVLKQGLPEQGVPLTTPTGERARLSFEDASRLRDQVFGSLIEPLKPWLFEFGSWIFGGLIAFNLVVVAALFAVGPKQPAVLVSLTALACALPIDVVGVFILKIIKDMNDLAIDDIMKNAFQNAHVQVDEAYSPGKESEESLYTKRTNIGLRYASRLAAISIVLTLFGMIAALWYMAWWVAVIFMSMVVGSFMLTMPMLAQLMRPESDAEKKQNRRAWEELNRQRKNARYSE